MSLAENLLNSIPEEENNDDSENDLYSNVEEHIVIDKGRNVIVPNSLKTIAVVGDKDIETISIDCVRYWDNHDLSTFAIYINYILPNGDEGTYIPEQIKSVEEEFFTFDWVIEKELTIASGKLTFWIVAKLTDDESNLLYQWSSFQNTECNIARGGDKIYVPEKQTDQDVISHAISISRNSAEKAEMYSNSAKEDADRAEAASIYVEEVVEDAAKKVSESLIVEVQDAANRAETAATSVENLRDQIESNSKYINAIWAGIEGKEPFVVDDYIAYKKDVPSNALPYAELNKLGGMSYWTDDSKNYIQSAKVTAIEIIGKNIFDSENAEILGGSNLNIVPLENGIRLVAITDGGYKYVTFLVTDDITRLKGKTLFASSDMIINNTDGRGYLNFITLDDKNNIVDTPSVIDNGTISGKIVSKLDIPENSSAKKLVIRCYATYSSGVSGDYVDYTNIQVEVSNTYTKYEPYTKTIFPIPQAVQNLEGYGCSNPDNPEESNYIDFEKKKFVRFGNIFEDESWSPRDPIEIDDLSDILPDDNFIQVEGGGTITAVNEKEKAVPFTITYMVRGEIL